MGFTVYLLAVQRTPVDYKAPEVYYGKMSLCRNLFDLGIEALYCSIKYDYDQLHEILIALRGPEILRISCNPAEFYVSTDYGGEQHPDGQITQGDPEACFAKTERLYHWITPWAAAALFDREHRSYELEHSTD